MDLTELIMRDGRMLSYPDTYWARSELSGVRSQLREGECLMLVRGSHGSPWINQTATLQTVQQARQDARVDTSLVRRYYAYSESVGKPA